MTTSLQAARNYRIAARIERLPISAYYLRLLFPIGFGWFCDAFDALAITFVLPFLIDEWHLAPSQAGLLLSSSLAGQALGSFLFAAFAERAGRIRSGVLALLLFSIFGIFCAFAGDYTVLLALRVAMGVGLGGLVPILVTYALEFSGTAYRARITIGFQLLFSIGIIAVGFAARWIIPVFGWRWMFVVAALPALLGAMPLFMRLPESPRWLANRGRGDEADRILQKVEEGISRNRPLPPIPVDFAEAPPAAARFSDLLKGIYRKRSLSLWIMWSCIAVTSYGLTAWMPSLYRLIYRTTSEHAISMGLISVIAGFGAIVAAVCLVDVLGRRPLIVSGFLLAAIPFLVLVATDLPAGMLLIVVTAGFCFAGLPQICLNPYTGEMYPTSLRALGSGVANAWFRAAAVASPALMGLMLEKAGIHAIFLLCGIAMLTAGAVSWKFAIETKGKTLEQLSSPSPDTATAVHAQTVKPLSITNTRAGDGPT